MIISISHSQMREEKWLLEAVLNCPPSELIPLVSQRPPVISIVGGGGKTTCVKAIATECYDKGIRAAVATTTHMQMPHDEFLLDAEDMDAFYALMEREGQVWLGRRLDPGAAGRESRMVKNKSRALSLDFVRRVCREGGVPVIIEADGARCLPCKAPADHEPVIPEETTHVLSVYGLDALGQRIADIAFRPELVSDILGKEPADLIGEDDLVSLALSDRAGRKAVTDAMAYCVVLNKADNDAMRDQAKEIAAKMTAQGVSRVLITNDLVRLMHR